MVGYDKFGVRCLSVLLYLEHAKGVEMIKPLVVLIASLCSIAGDIYVTSHYVKTPTLLDNVMMGILIFSLTMMVASIHDLLVWFERRKV